MTCGLQRFNMKDEKYDMKDFNAKRGTIFKCGTIFKMLILRIILLNIQSEIKVYGYAHV